TADHVTSSGPNAPTNSAELSSAPVRSSARSLSDMRSSQRAARGEVLHHGADAEDPVLAFVAAAHAVDELAELGGADGDDVVALVGKALPRRVAVLHRREHGAEEQRKSIRILMHGADGLRHQILGIPADLADGRMAVQHKAVLALDRHGEVRLPHVI